MTPRFAIALLLLTSALEAQLLVGRAAVKITPPAGVPMAGYYSVRLAEGTHDDLYAKALVFESGGVRAALVACDLVAVERDLVEEARQAVERATGIRAAHVLISATHSHTGPLMRPRFLAAMEGAPVEAARKYRAMLPGRIAESVRQAAQNLASAGAWAGTGKEESVAFYRRFLMKDGTVRTNPGKGNPEIVQPAGTVDPDVAVVYFDSPQGAPLATHVNYALHLDTVGGLQFSADYPLTLATLLGRIKGPEMLTQFTIGAAGNINHVDVRIRDPQKGHGEAARIGTVLAGEVLKTYPRLERLTVSTLRVLGETLSLPIPSFTAEEAAKATQVAARFGKTPAPPFLDLVHAFKVLDIADRKGRPLSAEVQVIALGDKVAWVGLPGEIFVELGVAIKRASPFPYTIVVGLANGSINYVPTRKAFGEGAYEVVNSRCAAGCGEALADSAIGLLVAAHRGRSSR